MVNVNLKKVFNGNNSFVKLASVLFHSQVQSHIMHLQTDSYARHMALGSYYDGIVDLIDRLIETGQGRKMSVFTGYTFAPLQDNLEPLSYFTSLLHQVEALRLELGYPFAEQICDDIIELISSTIYKLQQLK